MMEKNYLKDNPNRRCPSISKARNEIGFDPKIELNDGIERTLKWYKYNFK